MSDRPELAVDLPEVHAEALASTGRIVSAISNGALDLPSACAGWSVRALLNHVVAGNWWAVELTAGLTIGQVGNRFDGDMFGDDLSDAYDRSAEAAEEAFRAEGAMEAPCAVSYGPVPGWMYCGHRFVDVLVHGWDLAAATGQGTTMPSHLVEVCWAVVEPQLELLQASGMFGMAGDATASPDPQARLLAVLGRG